MLKALHLLIAFWVLMVIGLAVGWLTNDYWLGSLTLWIIIVAIPVVTGVLTTLCVLWVRRILQQPRLTALYVVLGLWPILALLGAGILQFDNIWAVTTFLPESMWWTQLWLPFIIGSVIVMGSLVYRTYHAKKDKKLLKQTATISTIGVICLVIILILHAVLPGPAERVIDRYLATHYSSYTVTNTEWYHSCCMEVSPSNSEQANRVIYTVSVPAGTEYFVMGDTNRDNDVVTFGQQEWSTPTEVAPSDIDSYRHF